MSSVTYTAIGTPAAQPGYSKVVVNYDANRASPANAYRHARAASNARELDYAYKASQPYKRGK